MDRVTEQFEDFLKIQQPKNTRYYKVTTDLPSRPSIDPMTGLIEKRTLVGCRELYDQG